MCSEGYRKSDWHDYLSDWKLKSINNQADTLENINECWRLVKQNVPTAVGIFFRYEHFSNCRAITDATRLKPWPSSFPDAQDAVKLCILRSQMQSGNF